MSDEHQLAPREPDAADAYERRYMIGTERLFHHHKRRAPAWMQLLLASTFVSGIGLLFAAEWLGATLLLVMGTVVWALFAVVRVVVTDQTVSVQYGLFGPKIPLRSIESASAVDYDWMRFGGWGIRRSRDGEDMYNIPGDKGRALRIEWRDAEGSARVTMVGMPEPTPTVAAIEAAIAARPSRTAIDGESPRAWPSVQRENGSESSAD